MLKDKAIDLNMEIPILVEGNHDVNALREIGFKGHIIKINRGLSLDIFAEKIARNFPNVIILMDFDRRGRSINERLVVLLKSYGCNINRDLWDFIMKNYNIKSVEDIPWLIRKVLSESESGIKNRF
jgi:5S rRNA maturation endonuclease (ribonuclease M5)